jgi:hypothetical protein
MEARGEEGWMRGRIIDGGKRRKDWGVKGSVYPKLEPC